MMREHEEFDTKRTPKELPPKKKIDLGMKTHQAVKYPKGGASMFTRKSSEIFAHASAGYGVIIFLDIPYRIDENGPGSDPKNRS